MTKRIKRFKRPQTITGWIVGIGAIFGGGILFIKLLPAILAFAAGTLGLAALVLAIGAILYMAMDGKMRALLSFAYKSLIRWITNLYAKTAPLDIMRAYVEDLKANLLKMTTLIADLFTQKSALIKLIKSNTAEILTNLNLAKEARDNGDKRTMTLKTRKAARLEESNEKTLKPLLRKMEVLYKVLTKTYENSETLMNDIADEVKVKVAESKAIKTGHSAMRSAMNIIKGNSDKRMMFDKANEALVEEIGQKVGDIEQMMDFSSDFMATMDLQNGVFEEEGLRMLERWENEGVFNLLDDEPKMLVEKNPYDGLDLDEERPEMVPVTRSTEGKNEKSKTGTYDQFFD